VTPVSTMTIALLARVEVKLAKELGEPLGVFRFADEHLHCNAYCPSKI
jgi:hypothetical protein